MVECRICQEEDWDTGMEAPCACRGSLKLGSMPIENASSVGAMRRVTPSAKYACRGNWQVARHDLHDSQVITMVPSERDFMDEYDDYFPVRTRSSALCCRTVAIIVSLTTSSDIVIQQFLALLVLRHTLPLMVGGDGEYSFALFLGNQGTYMFFSDTEDEDDDEEEEEDADADPGLPHYQPRLIPVY
ncbi:hypothetical protein TRIUR3_08435 [Triticum urartu]|uniref:RING-CH-type domain-containing protein n=1 Tax=Triticum urartu TaxID=4572 RepID=M7YXU8_TRIUA|nr:hypothetical protein TRIUR3_08435 [Triticum urartu]